MVLTSCQANDDHSTTKRQGPDRDRSFRSCNGSSAPNVVNDCEGSNGIRDIVGSMGEGSDASGEDLHERVQMLGVVGESAER